MTSDIKEFGKGFQEKDLEDFLAYIKEEWDPLEFERSYAGVFGNVFDIDLVGKYGLEIGLRTYDGKWWEARTSWKLGATTVNITDPLEKFSNPKEALEDSIKQAAFTFEEIAEQSINLCHCIMETQNDSI